MNRRCSLAAVAVALVLLGAVVMGDDNDEYRDQRYDNLIGYTSNQKGDFTLAILHIACEISDPSFPSGRNTTVYKSVYFPKVDEYSELRNHFTQNVLDFPDISVRVWLEFPAFNMRSESRIMLYNLNHTTGEKYQNIVGSRAITVVMEEGVMKELFWDDSCVSCIGKNCLEDSCSTNFITDLRPACQDSQALEEDPYRCGIKIYVAWMGTDRDGRSLTTYTSVPSRFQKYSFITSAYDAAAGFSTDFLSFWKQPLN